MWTRTLASLHMYTLLLGQVYVSRAVGSWYHMHGGPVLGLFLHLYNAWSLLVVQEPPLLQCRGGSCTTSCSMCLPCMLHHTDVPCELQSCTCQPAPDGADAAFHLRAGTEKAA